MSNPPPLPSAEDEDAFWIKELMDERNRALAPVAPPPPPPPPPPAQPHTPRVIRHDGWTVEKQRIFLTVLADTGCVSDAAVLCGMSVRSAYRLRRRPGYQAFATAWSDALGIAMERLGAEFLERAFVGVPRKIIHKGEVIGTERIPSDRLLIFLLRHQEKQRRTPFGHRPEVFDKFGGDAGRALDAAMKKLQPKDDYPEGCRPDDPE